MNAYRRAIGLTLLGAAMMLPPPAGGGRVARGKVSGRLSRLTSRLNSNDQATRLVALAGIGRLGPEARAAAPSVVRLLSDRDEEVREAAVKALTAMKAAAVPALLQALRDPDPTVRLGALDALGHADEATPVPVHPLIALLRDRDPRLRRRASDYMAVYRNSAFVAPLIRVLESDADNSVKAAAAAALSNYGKDAAAAVPALIELTKAKGALGRVASDALPLIGEPAVPHLLRMLRRANTTQERRRALDILAGIGPEARQAVPLLTDWLSHADPDLRHDVADTLGWIGPEAKAALPRLKGCLRDPVWRVRLASASAIVHVDPAEKSMLPVLVDALQSPQADQRLQAAFIVMEAGPRASATVPHLVRLLGDADRLVQLAAIHALRDIGPAAAPARRPLEALAKDPDRVTARAAEEALRALRPR